MTALLRYSALLVVGLVVGLAILWSPLVSPVAHAQTEPRSSEVGYRLNPGDVLDISLFQEPDMRRELVILPDGTIAYPLAGTLQASGRTPIEVQGEIEARLRPFFPDPFVTVSVVQASGNLIFVTGAVRSPGSFSISGALDVVQALALAGGLADKIDPDEIIVLRREGTNQQALKVNYQAIQSGKDLSSNFVLRSGDVVMVPR